MSGFDRKIIRTRLKFLFESVTVGVWGSEPTGDGFDVVCVRVADFNRSTQRVQFADPTYRAVSPVELAARKLARQDILIEKSGGGDAWPVGFSVLFEPGEFRQLVVCSNFIARLRPRRENDARFLQYLLAHRYSSGNNRLFIKQTTGIQNLDLPAYLAQSVDVPPLEEQRVIADYLDGVTAAIDEHIAKMKRLVLLLEERAARTFQGAVERCGVSFPPDLTTEWRDTQIPRDWRLMKLSKTLTQLTNGYVGPTRDILVADGIPYIQSIHIKAGRIDFGRRQFFVERAWHDERPRINLRAGDVLIVQTGDIGQVAVVPEGFGDASCHALQIARVRKDLLSGEYLGAYLRSPFGYQSLLCRATGALHPHLEASIKDLVVLVPPKAVQATILSEVNREQARDLRVTDKLLHEISLQQERRQAIIAAATAGHIDLRGAA